MPWIDWGEDGKVRTLKITVDSGAAESVLPDRDSPGIQWVEAPANRLYRAANGTTIKDKGAEKVSYDGPDGKARAMTFRIADVTKPFASVARMCGKGNRVVRRGVTSSTRRPGRGRTSRGTWVSSYLRFR